MNLKEITEFLIALSSMDSESTEAPTKCSLSGKPVIVRCRDAGVHFGYLGGYSGRVVELKNSRRMWKWWAASEHSLSGVARCGINQSKSKIAGELETIILQDACEIIPMTDPGAINSIQLAEVYNEQ